VRSSRRGGFKCSWWVEASENYEDFHAVTTHRGCYCKYYAWGRRDFQGVQDEFEASTVCIMIKSKGFQTMRQQHLRGCLCRYHAWKVNPKNLFMLPYTLHTLFKGFGHFFPLELQKAVYK
jgi:hypothetical protein